METVVYVLIGYMGWLIVRSLIETYQANKPAPKPRGRIIRWPTRR